MGWPPSEVGDRVGTRNSRAPSGDELSKMGVSISVNPVNVLNKLKKVSVTCLHGVFFFPKIWNFLNHLDRGDSFE